MLFWFHLIHMCLESEVIGLIHLLDGLHAQAQCATKLMCRSQGIGDASAQGRSSPQPHGQPEVFMRQPAPRAASPLALKQEYTGTGSPGGHSPQSRASLEPVSSNFARTAPHNLQAIDDYTSQAPRSWTPTKSSGDYAAG